MNSDSLDSKIPDGGTRGNGTALRTYIWYSAMSWIKGSSLSTNAALSHSMQITSIELVAILDSNGYVCESKRLVVSLPKRCWRLTCWCRWCRLLSTSWLLVGTGEEKSSQQKRYVSPYISSTGSKIGQTSYSFKNQVNLMAICSIKCIRSFHATKEAFNCR